MSFFQSQFDKMKQIQLLIIFITLFATNTFGQNCWMVSGTKDIKTGIETKGGIVSSKDHYSLLIQKEIDHENHIKYNLILVAASRVYLSDSLTNSSGKIELFLTNGEKIILEDANCSNGEGVWSGSVNFTVRISESTLKKVINHPIQKLRAFNLLETEFSKGKQKKQQKILKCLTYEP